MGKEYRAKSFKSGNSVAIRMPAALGIEPDKEWMIVEKDGDFVVRAVGEMRRKFNIDKVAGSANSLKLIKSEDRAFCTRPLRWDLLDDSDPA